MIPPGAITRERSQQELILKMIERQILHCLLGLRQRRMIRRMITPCGRGRIAISIGSKLSHQEAPVMPSEQSLSVSLTLSSRGSAPGARGTMDGGPLSLRLLPAVGCEFTASAIMYFAEEPLQQSLA